MGFPREEHWNRLPFPPLGNLPQPRKTLLLLSCFSRVDSVRPHRRQPTRLSCPWDSPGKNTGVGCHFLLQGRRWDPSKPEFNAHSSWWGARSKTVSCQWHHYGGNRDEWRHVNIFNYWNQRGYKIGAKFYLNVLSSTVKQFSSGPP